MMTQKKSTNILLRVLIYSAFGAGLWLKFKASRSTQVAVVSLLFPVGIIVLNYYCGHLLWNRARLPAAQHAVLVARSTTIWVLAVGFLAILVCDIQIIRCLIHAAHGMGWSEETLGEAGLAGFIGLLFSYAGAYELRVTRDAVGYLSLIGGYRSLTRDEIDRARIRHGWYAYQDRFRPTNRLEVLPSTHTERPPIIVNLMAFKKADIERVLEWLGEKVKQDDDVEKTSRSL